MKYLQSVRKWSTIKWGILYMWCLYFSGKDRKLVKLLSKIYRDFPGGPVVKNWLSNAGVMGSLPDGGTKIPHATGKLSPWAATREKPTCCNSWARVLQSPCSMIWTFLPSVLCWFFSKGGKDLGFTVNKLGSHRRVLSINMRWLIYDWTGSLWLLCSEKVEGRQRKQGALSEGNNLSRKGLGSGCKEVQKRSPQDEIWDEKERSERQLRFLAWAVDRMGKRYTNMRITGLQRPEGRLLKLSFEWWLEMSVRYSNGIRWLNTKIFMFRGEGWAGNVSLGGVCT